MKLWRKISLLTLLCSATISTLATDNVVNVYAWSAVIADSTIHKFEKETGIKVNFSTYDSNEILYAKLRANKNAGYDVIEPSSYYVDRMRKQNMLESIDKNLLPNFLNLNPAFLNKAYDPNSSVSIPFIWGITGIFVNQHDFDAKKITAWSDLWHPEYKDQLLMMNDSREVFSIALKTLGYSANDADPEHIKQAYEKLKLLMPNIKIFNSDAMITMMIDEDASIGMVWNGAFYKAARENTQLQFVFPKDGFVIWVDNFAIPKNPPHKANAYKFLNFMLRADIAKENALYNNFPTANLAAQKILPDNIKNNPIVYPAKKVLRRGEFQTDISDEALALYEKYWEKLKMGG